jgi:hypothetical protein
LPESNGERSWPLYEDSLVPAPYDVGVITPDDFLIHQFHLNEELLREKLASQASARGVGMAALLDRLQRNAPNCVQLLR